MILTVRHRTSYSYDQPVLLGQQIIRLFPRTDLFCRLVDRTLVVSPDPDATRMALDHNNNVVQIVSFGKKSTLLKIEARVVLELKEFNPFDYIIVPDSCLRLPMMYPPEMTKALVSFTDVGTVHEDVRSFAFSVMQKSQHHIVSFVSMLCSAIHEACAYETRDVGEPHQPQKVWQDRKGSCRDLAVLYVAAARSVGLAARFVSGYFFDEKPQQPHLHAWAEVYMPGGGWRGFDPVLGVACYGHHIALAASALPSQSAAIEGTFIGAHPCQMKVSIEYEYRK